MYDGAFYTSLAGCYQGVNQTQSRQCCDAKNDICDVNDTYSQLPCKMEKMHVSLQSRGWPFSSLLKDSGANTEMSWEIKGSPEQSAAALSELAAHWLAAHALHLPAAVLRRLYLIISSSTDRAHS